MGSLLQQQDWAGGLAGGPQKVDIGKNGISCKPPGCTLNVSGCGTYLKCLTQKYPSHQKIPHTELLEELFKPQTNFMMLASWSDQSLVRTWIQVSCVLMLNNMKPAIKVSLLSVLQLVQHVAPLPLPRVKLIYLAGQSPAKENSAHYRQGKTW